MVTCISSSGKLYVKGIFLISGHGAIPINLLIFRTKVYFILLFLLMGRIYGKLSLLSQMNHSCFLVDIMQFVFSLFDLTKHNSSDSSDIFDNSDSFDGQKNVNRGKMWQNVFSSSKKLFFKIYDKDFYTLKSGIDAPVY